MPELKKISVSLCNPHPDNPRENFEDEGILASIREHGILTPAIVWGRASGEYTILAGHRRTFAANELQILRIPAVVFAEHELSEEKAQFILLEENIKHKTLEPVEEARAIASRIKKFGLTQKRLAEEYRRTQQWVSLRLQLLPKEDRPTRNDRRGRPTLKVSGITNRIVNTPTHTNQVLAAPEQAQPAVAKAVEQQRLSTRETKALVKAVRKAPPEKQLEIAEKAAESTDPVATAERLQEKENHKATTQKEREALKNSVPHPDLIWKESHGDVASKLAMNISKKILVMFGIEKFQETGPRYDLIDEVDSLRTRSNAFKIVLDWAQKHYDLSSEELAKRQSGKRATVTHLRPVQASQGETPEET